MASCCIPYLSASHKNWELKKWGAKFVYSGNTRCNKKQRLLVMGKLCLLYQMLSAARRLDTNEMEKRGRSRQSARHALRLKAGGGRRESALSLDALYCG
ncbi:hypothetical protein NDU88_004413 [Pleurodeles waltl]|uniref:Uncharacterized protein n=1 Tax=Pleurodeles waltl TaxID=8319 RepID=A0AAV7UF36_PLEWA|nr:hypothetical protein NDU88_004413 [Pleurodeles waltl]